MKKSELKKIIKECLIEILAEGLSSSPNSLSENIREVHQAKQNLSQKSSVQPTMISSRRIAESVSYGESAAIKQAIKEVSGKDNVLASVLADTAATTLPQMLNAEKSSYASTAMVNERGDMAAKAVDASDPTELFGEAATSSWAALAFSDSKKMPNNGL